MAERWPTDGDLAGAYRRYAARIPGFVLPAAYGVARRDQAGMTFGYTNTFGAVRPLPAVILAYVCGYAASTGVYRLTAGRFAEAARLLAPAEAAVHMPHPNLWSWRDLLAGASGKDQYLAFFLASAGDSPVDEDDAQFRELL